MTLKSMFDYVTGVTKMQTETYTRKPFNVEAVQVTDENITEVAEWCHGEIRSHAGGDGLEKTYIKVDVHQATNRRQTQAFAGDWVLTTGSTLKVYTNRTFLKNFEAGNYTLTADDFEDRKAKASDLITKVYEGRVTPEDAADQAMKAEGLSYVDKAIDPEGNADDEPKAEVTPEHSAE